MFLEIITMLSRFLVPLSLGIGVSQSNKLSADDSIEEIIVTASKKEQNIQDVAMSVQAIGAAELEKKNIKSLEDISTYLTSCYILIMLDQVNLIFILEEFLMELL